MASRCVRPDRGTSPGASNACVAFCAPAVLRPTTAPLPAGVEPCAASAPPPVRRVRPSTRGLAVSSLPRPPTSASVGSLLLRLDGPRAAASPAVAPDGARRTISGLTADRNAVVERALHGLPAPTARARRRRRARDLELYQKKRTAAFGKAMSDVANLMELQGGARARHRRRVGRVGGEGGAAARGEGAREVGTPRRGGGGGARAIHAQLDGDGAGERAPRGAARRRALVAELRRASTRTARHRWPSSSARESAFIRLNRRALSAPPTTCSKRRARRRPRAPRPGARATRRRRRSASGRSCAPLGSRGCAAAAARRSARRQRKRGGGAARGGRAKGGGRAAAAVGGRPAARRRHRRWLDTLVAERNWRARTAARTARPRGSSSSALPARDAPAPRAAPPLDAHAARQPPQVCAKMRAAMRKNCAERVKSFLEECARRAVAVKAVRNFCYQSVKVQKAWRRYAATLHGRHPHPPVRQACA